MSAHDTPSVVEKLAQMDETSLLQCLRLIVSNGNRKEKEPLFTAGTPQGGAVFYRRLPIPCMPPYHAKVTEIYGKAILDELAHQPLTFHVRYHGSGESLGGAYVDTFAIPEDRRSPHHRMPYAYVQTWLGFVIGMAVNMKGLISSKQDDKWLFHWNEAQVDTMVAGYVQWLRHAIPLGCHTEGFDSTTFFNDTWRPRSLNGFLRRAALHLAANKATVIRMTLPETSQMERKWMNAILRDMRYFADNGFVAIRLVCELDPHAEDCDYCLVHTDEEEIENALWPSDGACNVCAMKILVKSVESTASGIEKARLQDALSKVEQERSNQKRDWAGYLDNNKGKITWEWAGR